MKRHVVGSHVLHGLIAVQGFCKYTVLNVCRVGGHPWRCPGLSPAVPAPRRCPPGTAARALNAVGSGSAAGAAAGLARRGRFLGTRPTGPGGDAEALDLRLGCGCRLRSAAVGVGSAAVASVPCGASGWAPCLLGAGPARTGCDAEALDLRLGRGRFRRSRGFGRRRSCRRTGGSSWPRDAWRRRDAQTALGRRRGGRRLFGRLCCGCAAAASWRPAAWRPRRCRAR